MSRAARFICRSKADRSAVSPGAWLPFPAAPKPYQPVQPVRDEGNIARPSLERIQLRHLFVAQVPR